jgi:hypothetical protein
MVLLGTTTIGGWSQQVIPQWEYHLNQACLGYDVVSDRSRVYFTMMCDSPRLADQIFCLDRTSGELIWTKNLGGISGKARIIDERFTTTVRNRVISLNPEDGTEKYTWSPPPGHQLNTLVENRDESLVVTHQFSSSPSNDSSSFYLLDSCLRPFDSLSVQTAEFDLVMEEPVSGVFNNRNHTYYLMGGGRIHEHPFTRERSFITEVDLDQRRIRRCFIQVDSMTFAGLPPLTSDDTLWIHNGWDRVSMRSAPNLIRWTIQLPDSLKSANRSWIKWKHYLITDPGNRGVVTIFEAETGKIDTAFNTGHSTFGSQWLVLGDWLLHTNSHGLFSLRKSGSKWSFDKLNLPGATVHKALTARQPYLYLVIDNQLIAVKLLQEDLTD